jgi:hypothetical protein
VARELEEAEDCEGFDDEPSDLPCLKRKADADGYLSGQEGLERDLPSATDSTQPDRRPRVSTHPETSPSAIADAKSNVRTPGRKAYKKRQKIAQRKAKQQKCFIQNATAPSPADVGERLSAATTIPIELPVDDLPTNSSGYEAKNPENKDDSVLNMEELLASGYTLIEWDGR